MKTVGEKIAALTAYDAVTARLLDDAGVDVLLVGDSAAMVVLGYENTLPVTLDAMLVLTAAVARAGPSALVVGDLPFMSYEAVKLEGGRKVVPAARAVLDAGIPVMGHIGLTPQSIHELGGYRVQGKSEDSHAALLSDARALDEAGCFSIVLEAMPWRLAKEITETVSVPTIGIGAGPHCDGQVLVVNDILGYAPGRPARFVRAYGDTKSVVSGAARGFVRDVKSGAYPSLDESYP
jgi:3-methyl-2-oxobutanoate hydroxymethyltransferase